MKQKTLLLAALTIGISTATFAQKNEVVKCISFNSSAEAAPLTAAKSKAKSTTDYVAYSKLPKRFTDYTYIEMQRKADAVSNKETQPVEHKTIKTDK